MSEAPELNVWREASDAASENAVKWKPAAEDRAAAVIRTYGDQRDADARSEGHAEGYAQAIADVVEWLGECADTHEAVALDIAGNALGDGFYNADAATRYRAAANEITRRFGKGQDQNPVK